jgi:nucleoid-associated protein YgaU
MLRSDYRGPAHDVELRLEQLAADGGVAHRLTAPFAVAAGERQGRVANGEEDTYVVARGNSLWLIARRVYGRGPRYTAIYTANQDVIRDPERIYPGQALRLPRP